jgi:hypothetical protein
MVSQQQLSLILLGRQEIKPYEKKTGIKQERKNKSEKEEQKIKCLPHELLAFTLSNVSCEKNPSYASETDPKRASSLKNMHTLIVLD